MNNKRFPKLLGVLLSCVLAFSNLMPSVALAIQSDVHVDGQGSANPTAKQVSGITVGDVAAPSGGEALDDSAQVRTAEGESWEIPVLWVDLNMNLATQATEGQKYLPVLAFFVPDGISVKDAANGFNVTLADDLAQLFGGHEVISVFDESTGITFILPSTLRSFITRAKVLEALASDANTTTAADESLNRQELGATLDEAYKEELEDGVEQEEEGDQEQPADSEEEPEKQRDIVDIYCSQTAKDELSHDDLEYLVDLIINKLHPQAINLLLEKFPAFKAAAERGEIGTEISLYVYYEEGDKDGKVEHESATLALAYVTSVHIQTDGGVKYVYMLAVDASDVSKEDASGRLMIDRSSTNTTTLQNTIVHELFHAFMDDYNRPGMTGVSGPDDMLVFGETMTEEKLKHKALVQYPKWFVEGTASSVENVYAYRLSMFESLTNDFVDSDGEKYDGCSPFAILNNFLTSYTTKEGELMYFPLWWSSATTTTDGRKFDNTASAYVSGYLATLYLGELAARQNGGSSYDQTNGSFSSENIRMGLNSILERMHNGETLDQVIANISPVNADGSKRYTSAEDFENKFICGAKNEERQSYRGDAGDDGSLVFVSRFLGYMRTLESEKGTDRTYDVNGSILFDFTEDYATPLDPEKNDSTSTLKIVESNEFHESTVPGEVALAGGGKSVAGAKGTGNGAGAAAASQEETAQTPQQPQSDEAEPTPQVPAPVETPAETPVETIVVPETTETPSPAETKPAA